MSLVAESLECPNCGATISIQQRECDYCHSPVVVRRIQDIGNKSPQEVSRYVTFYQNFIKTQRGESSEILTALGVCLLQKGSYVEAVKHLEKAISLLPENGESHYYLALAMLQKKRPYLHTLNKIKKIVQYVESALTYETSGKYYYLLYLIQVDFYDKKHLRNGKNAAELLADATANELDDEDTIECKEYCNLP